ncbi:MAG TPA: hypothetical protein PK629_03730 [Oscillospiraceae bacterium]|nr:hypothetical protein [Oscillospiraceae bacterium]HPF55532.1 hypothetical protein [Clostridiales bacterium]HPK35694.1 hypothetical protein [Oscillospiraceae bacterium]HPR76395.1 hypothetical protein [Oscillospiraceae bacterium]
MSYQYILRYGIAPGFHEEEAVSGLLEFCQSAQIDNVMFHLNCEQLNRGHISIEQTTPWLETIKRAGEQLAEIGVKTSINPWITTLHADRGRKLWDFNKFGTMVDPWGQKATAVVCPADPEFQKYLCEMYAYYATIQPDTIWVEDDFRLHNHAPLKWGGCFCERHMAIYSERAGKPLSREEFVKGVLMPGEPHPYRKIWLDVSRETMRGLAKKIGAAVHAVSPETKVGLMSSSPKVHCAEGRDWSGILRGLAGENDPVSRPHLPSYQDVTMAQYEWNFAAHSCQTAADCPSETLIYPELEGYPFGRFVKSKAMIRAQLLTSVLLPADGMTLNLFDMMGDVIIKEYGYDKVLSQAKPVLERITALGLKNMQRKGVCVPINEKASYSLHTIKGERMEELYPDESFWFSFLSAHGIPCRFVKTTDFSGEIVAVSGQYFRSLTEDMIKKLFTHNIVLLDGEAANTLFEMGLGELALISGCERQTGDAGPAIWHQVVNGVEYTAIPEARVGVGDCYFNIRYSEAPYLITEAKNYMGEAVGNGIALTGSKCLIFPFSSPDMPSALLTPIHRDILFGVIASCKSAMPCAVGGTYLFPALFSQEDKDILLIVNFSPDETDDITVFIPRPEQYRKIILDGCEDPEHNGEYYSFRKKLATGEAAVLTLIR